MTLKIPTYLAQGIEAKIKAAARQDLSVFQQAVFPAVSGEPYVDAVHSDILAWALEKAVLHGDRRLLIAAPPRHFKSYLVSQVLPAWLLGRRPGIKIICASYGLELANQFGALSRSILQSDRYKQIFPDTKLAQAMPAVHDLRTTKGGYRYATSVAGPVTGLGADVIIIDDPLKAIDGMSGIARQNAFEWFKSAILTRMDKPDEAIVIVAMQRLHQDDLFGRLRAEGGWSVLKLPAEFDKKTTLTLRGGETYTYEAGQVLFPQNFSPAALAKVRNDLGDQAYSAQFLQKPVPAGGNLFKMKKFGRFNLEEWNSLWKFEAVYLSVDTAVSMSKTADYTAITQWGVRGRHLYLLGAWRGRWKLEEQIAQILKRQKGRRAIIIEDAHSGRILADVLGQHIEPERILLKTPLYDKEHRAILATVHVLNGDILLPNAAPWLEAFEDEVAAFPHGKHDDFVDTLSQMVMSLNAPWAYWQDLVAWPMKKRLEEEASKPKQMGDHS